MQLTNFFFFLTFQLEGGPHRRKHFRPIRWGPPWDGGDPFRIEEDENWKVKFSFHAAFFQSKVNNVPLNEPILQLLPPKIVVRCCHFVEIGEMFAEN